MSNLYHVCNVSADVMNNVFIHNVKDQQITALKFGTALAVDFNDDTKRIEARRACLTTRGLS